MSWVGDEASVQPSHLEKRGELLVGFFVGEGCWGWQEVDSPVVCVFNALWLAVGEAGPAASRVPSPG